MKRSLFFSRVVVALITLLFSALSPVVAAQALKVSVAIEGAGRGLAEELTPVASLGRGSTSYNTLAPIRRAAETDAAAIASALQSKGYYAAEVQSDVTRRGNEVSVTFLANPGERFRITDYRIIYAEDRDDPRPGTHGMKGIVANGDPSGEALAAIETSLLSRLWNNGFLGATITDQRVLADFTKATAVAEFEISSGPKAYYGDINVTGERRVDPDFIRQFRPYTIGDVAQRKQVDKYRDRLSETGLFSQIEVTPQLPKADGETEILVRVDERKHRTLGGGLSYATDVGPGTTVFWENRNLLGRGETLRAQLTASQPRQEISTQFRKQRPRLPGYYTLALNARNEDTDAFRAQTGEVVGTLAKLWLDRNLTTEGGIRLQYSDIREPQGSDGTTTQSVRDDEIFRAMSFPLSIVWNSQSNPLDPADGFVVTGQFEPFFGTVDFQKVEVSATDRVFFGKNDRYTLAGRGKFGAIYGAGRGDIPATERYYAGGGGSLRGYVFQEASPIDTGNGDILGGASLAELNVEARAMITKNLQLAIFSDAGGAFENNTPDFDQVLIGAGLGIRYYTPIGPLRVDFAIPVERRNLTTPDPTQPDGVASLFRDPDFQFYIAIGQPF